MATSRLSEVVQHLRRAMLLRDGAGLTDGQLLERFVADREDAALGALVRRHAPMVWGVCRRILQDHHQAEDAFQATFLVLVRKAASIVPREKVANWLYGVACQTALKARATSAKRRARERQVTEMPEPEALQHDLWSDLLPLLDQELSRLPEKYRAAIVLCDLEGKTRKEAARQLAMPEGTIASRLARARTMLASRLARKGLAVSAGALAAALTQNGAVACVPTSVVSSTIKSVGLFAAGQTAAAGAISAKVAGLTEGVLKAMLLSKLKIATAVMLAGGIVAAAVSSSGVFDPTEATAKAAALASAKQPEMKDVAKQSKKDVDWKEIEKELRSLTLEHLQLSLKSTHGDVLKDHGPGFRIQDCKKCHDIGTEDKLRGFRPKGGPEFESDQEKISRLEKELATVQSEKELLQLEVWVLLREIQRQNMQNKDGK